jgi:hypothetical protein
MVKLSFLSTGRVYSPGNVLDTHPFQKLNRSRAKVRPEGCKWKIPMTPSEIEPVAFGLVAKCLNQQCHHVPPYMYKHSTFCVLRGRHENGLASIKRKSAILITSQTFNKYGCKSGKEICLDVTFIGDTNWNFLYSIARNIPTVILQQNTYAWFIN